MPSFTINVYYTFVLYHIFMFNCVFSNICNGKGQLWSWAYGSWIYNYLCNQWLSPLALWVWMPPTRSVLDTTLCEKVYQWLATGWYFSPDTSVSSTNATERQDITEILLALNPTIPTHLWKGRRLSTLCNLCLIPLSLWTITYV
jgi:hypothetical protein